MAVERWVRKTEVKTISNSTKIKRINKSVSVGWSVNYEEQLHVVQD